MPGEPARVAGMAGASTWGTTRRYSTLRSSPSTRHSGLSSRGAGQGGASRSSRTVSPPFSEQDPTSWAQVSVRLGRSSRSPLTWWPATRWLSTGSQPTWGSRATRRRTRWPRRPPGAELSTSRTRLGGRLASPTSLDEPPRVEPGPPLSGSGTTSDRSGGPTPQGRQAFDAEPSAGSESRQHSAATSCCPATLR